MAAQAVATNTPYAPSSSPPVRGAVGSACATEAGVPSECSQREENDRLRGHVGAEREPTANSRRTIDRSLTISRHELIRPIHNDAVTSRKTNCADFADSSSGILKESRREERGDQHGDDRHLGEQQPSRAPVAAEGTEIATGESREMAAQERSWGGPPAPAGGSAGRHRFAASSSRSRVGCAAHTARRSGRPRSFQVRLPALATKAR